MCSELRLIRWATRWWTISEQVLHFFMGKYEIRMHRMQFTLFIVNSRETWVMRLCSSYLIFLSFFLSFFFSFLLFLYTCINVTTCVLELRPHQILVLHTVIDGQYQPLVVLCSKMRVYIGNGKAFPFFFPLPAAWEFGNFVLCGLYTHQSVS